MDGATMWELWKVNCSGKIGEGNQNTKYYHKVTDKFLPPPLFFPQYLLTWTQEHSKPRNSHQTWTERAPREAIFFCFKEPEDSMAQRECRKLFFIFLFFLFSPTQALRQSQVNDSSRGWNGPFLSWPGELWSEECEGSPHCFFVLIH